MIIYDGFYLSGFSRIDKGEAGAVFVHYDEPQNGRGRKAVACAIVTRTSKNNYTATVYDEQRIETFRAHSLDGLRRTVADFFKGIAA